MIYGVVYSKNTLQLAIMFMSRFLSNKIQQRSLAYLMSIRQKEGESLIDFVRSFNAIAMITKGSRMIWPYMHSLQAPPTNFSCITLSITLRIGSLPCMRLPIDLLKVMRFNGVMLDPLSLEV